MLRPRMLCVVPIPCLQDNYAYLLYAKTLPASTAAPKDTAENTQVEMPSFVEGVLVDPVEPRKVMDVLRQHQDPPVRIHAILTTHHHWDHASGNEEMVRLLREQQQAPKVLAGDERVPQWTNLVQHGQEWKIGESLTIRCLHTPGHTSGSMSYYCTTTAGSKKEPQPPGVVFTGDTLFLGGCGRFFEGSPQQMHSSLLGVLAKLPVQTRVYCGHEYTRANLQFAVSVDPVNRNLQERMGKLLSTAGDTFAIPGTIEEELETNPFLRVDQPSIQQAMGSPGDPVETMKRLREAKNRF